MALALQPWHLTQGALVARRFAGKCSGAAGIGMRLARENSKYADLSAVFDRHLDGMCVLRGDPAG